MLDPFWDLWFVETKIVFVGIIVVPAEDFKVPAKENEFEITVSYNIIGQEIPSQQYSFILEAAR